MSTGLRKVLALVALVALAAGGARVVDDYSMPGAGFSTVQTAAADPTGPTGPGGGGGMTGPPGGGSQFSPPSMPSQPDYQGANQPPLDQNNGISIYNTGFQGAPQQVGQVNGSQQGLQPGQNADGSWQRAANGEQNPPNYSTAPAYTGQQSIPNTAPPQQGQQQDGQQEHSQEQSQQATPQQPTSTITTPPSTSRRPAPRTSTSQSVSTVTVTVTAPPPPSPYDDDGLPQNVLQDTPAWDLVSKSPKMMDEWSKLEAADWKIRFGPSGGGTKTDYEHSVIILDVDQQGDPIWIGKSLTHEFGHAMDAYNLVPANNVDDYLAGEGDAVLNELETRLEIVANGGDDAVIETDDIHDQFMAIYDTYKAAGGESNPAARQTARQAIGKIYGTLHPSGCPDGVNYVMYYTIPGICPEQ
ncbi:hypothetical protein [Mycobacteroides abscessus]